MIYSTDYDHYVYLDDPDFTCVDVDTGKIFKGNAYTGDYFRPYFDLAEFARNDMSLDFDWVDNFGVFNGVKQYDITSGGSTQSVFIGYDSNMNLGPEIGTIALRNDNIATIQGASTATYVRPGQDVFYTVFNESSSQLNIEVELNDIVIDALNSVASRAWHFKFRIPENAEAGNIFQFYNLDAGLSEFFTIIDSQCNYRFALQYVNRFGGLDTMLLDHEYQEYYTNTELDSNRRVARTNNRPILQKHQYHTIQNTGLKGFYLNTFMMTNEESSKMDHLMLSPMVFLQDIEKGITYPVNIIGKPFTVQCRNVNNTEINKYQINVRISRDIIRRG